MIKEGELIFNNKSTLDLNLRLEEYPTISACNMEYKTTKVDGADGSKYIDLNIYPDVLITCNFDLYSYDLEVDLVKVQKWLRNIEDNRLWFDQDQKCYLVKKVLDGDRKKETRNILDEPITFICEPFRYDIEESHIIINNTDGYTSFDYAFTSDTELETDATIVVHNSTILGEVNLVWGEGAITVENIVTKDIIINTADYTVREGTRTISYENGDRSWDYTGKFPTIENGLNRIWSNNISFTSIEIFYRNKYY